MNVDDEETFPDQHWMDSQHTLNSIFLGCCQYCTYDKIAQFGFFIFLPFSEAYSLSVIKNICWHVALMYRAPLLLHHPQFEEGGCHELVLAVPWLTWVSLLGIRWELHMLSFQMWLFVKVNENKWMVQYSMFFSVNAPPHLIPSDPSPQQQGLSSLCSCIGTVFLLCIMDYIWMSDHEVT